MVDSEYRKDNFQSLNLSISATTKNAEILRFVPDHIYPQKAVG